MSWTTAKTYITGEKITAAQLNTHVRDNTTYTYNHRAPTGAVIMYAVATAPTGWLLCDGAAVSRSTYATLFGVIGTTFGVGDGSTTFNLPDMRGRAPIGTGTGSGLTARTLAATVGTETHVLTTNELPSHEHVVSTSLFPGNSTAAYRGDTGSGTITSGSTGSGAAHNNMQPSLALSFIIKT